ncbi:MAG: glycosyltransferase family 4 protein [Segetibacter sp.]|nr:glycosyltransferase family 4 protein [Segetibacter sp.]
MKIVHISHLYYPSSGGVQFFFKNVSERLVKDYGDEVTVVTTNSYYGPERQQFKKIETREEVINGVKVVRFQYRRWHIGLYSFLFKLFAKLGVRKPEWMGLQASGPYSPEMKKYLMNVEADAFCGSSTNYWFMQLPLWRKCNFFYYGSIHLDEEESKSALYKVQVDSMNASTLYLANTSFEIERLVKLGVRREKIMVLGAGVDMEPFLNVDSESVQQYRKELGIPGDGLLIGYIGRIEFTKNVLLVIKAFEKISTKFQNTYLLIAGSGNGYVSVIKEYCSRLPQTVQSRIKWRVSFAVEEKPLIFHSLDILVLPSHNESFGLVFLEAWSCKKPVIGVDIGSVRHVITDGKDGLLMNIDDEESLSEKLGELIKDDALRTTMGKNGFEKVKEKYTWSKIVARLRRFYEEGALKND